LAERATSRGAGCRLDHWLAATTTYRRRVYPKPTGATESLERLACVALGRRGRLRVFHQLGFIEAIRFFPDEAWYLGVALTLGVAAVVFGIRSRRLAFFLTALALSVLHLCFVVPSMFWIAKEILVLRVAVPEHQSAIVLHEVASSSWDVPVWGCLSLPPTMWSRLKVHVYVAVYARLS
jgi:hypothetical protein